MNTKKDKIKEDKIVMRPVIFVDRNCLHQYATSLRHLFVGLAADSFVSALVCPLDSSGSSVICPSVEVIYYPALKLPLFWIQNRRILIEKLSKFKPTVLHCFCKNKARLVKWVARELNIPYILSFNSLEKGINPSIDKEYCASLIGSTKSISIYLEKKYHSVADRILQINIGTFVNDTCACFSQPGQLASLVIVQKLENTLEFEPLLNAIKHLAVDGYEFAFALIGRGPAEKEIHELVKSLGLTQIVTMVPSIQPIRAVLTGADIYIQLQPRAEFNSGLLEAMSVGNAVAMCRGEDEDLLEDNKTAVFFDGDDELSIYSCLKKLLARHEYARQIAQTGQLQLRQHHTVSEMINRLKETYLQAQQWFKDA